MNTTSSSASSSQRTRMRNFWRGKRTKKRTKNKIENSGEAEKNNRKNKEQRTGSKKFPRCARPVPFIKAFSFYKSLIIASPFTKDLIKNFPRCARPEFFVLSKVQRTKNKYQNFEFRDIFCCFTSTIFVLLKEVTESLVYIYILVVQIIVQ